MFYKKPRIFTIKTYISLDDKNRVADCIFSNTLQNR